MRAARTAASASESVAGSVGVAGVATAVGSAAVVAAARGRHAELCKPRDVPGPRFTELITCKKTFTLEWRRSVCAHFGLLPGVI